MSRRIERRPAPTQCSGMRAPVAKLDVLTRKIVFALRTLAVPAFRVLDRTAITPSVAPEAPPDVAD